MTADERKDMVDCILSYLGGPPKTAAVLRPALTRMGDMELGVLYGRAVSMRDALVHYMDLYTNLREEIRRPTGGFVRCLQPNCIVHSPMMRGTG